MRRPACIVFSLILASGGLPAAPAQAQGTAFVSEVRAACASELAALQKYMLEMQGFTLAEADNRQINPRLESLYTWPAYGIREAAEKVGEGEFAPLWHCAAKIRLPQLQNEGRPRLAASAARPVGDCSIEWAELKGFAPKLADEALLVALRKEVKATATGQLNEGLTRITSIPEEPLAPLSLCLARAELASRTAGSVPVTTVGPPASPTPAAGANGATAQQIADAEAVNAMSRESAARQKAESDAALRDAAIRSGKIYQSNGPEGRQVELHPTTGQRCVTAELGPNEPYGNNGRVHVIQFTNVCGKIFSVRARIIPLGAISETSGGVQGTGIGAGALGQPAKARLICIEDPSRNVGGCTGFTEWWTS